MRATWANDLQWLQPGLIAITGGEGTGKTTLLRGLSADSGLPATPTGIATHPDARWLNLALPAHSNQTPGQFWGELQTRCTGWQNALHADLVDALNLAPHLDKRLEMLSSGSRRKVALAGLLACGATVTCLDQPYAALDGASINVIRSFLQDVADHPHRTWLVADYEPDSRLVWRRVISLD